MDKIMLYMLKTYLSCYFYVIVCPSKAKHDEYYLSPIKRNFVSNLQNGTFIDYCRYFEIYAVKEFDVVFR